MSDYDFDAYDDEHDHCQTCGGEGFEECDDPIWCFERDCDGDYHPCPNCGGSGRAKDQTWW